jgi:hypothetical protein
MERARQARRAARSVDSDTIHAGRDPASFNADRSVK